MPATGYKSIGITEETYNKIQEAKHKGQSVDGFIQELLDLAKKNTEQMAEALREKTYHKDGE